jgi:hypothetical protein
MAVGITIRAVAIMRIISQISIGCTREQAAAGMVTAVCVRRPIGLSKFIMRPRIALLRLWCRGLGNEVDGKSARRLGRHAKSSTFKIHPGVDIFCGINRDLHVVAACASVTVELAMVGFCNPLVCVQLRFKNQGSLKSMRMFNIDLINAGLEIKAFNDRNLAASKHSPL